MWIEKIIEANAYCDWAGRRVAVRAYNVWDASRETIIFTPNQVVNDSGAPMPTYGSFWQGMYLDSYSVTGIGAGVYEVLGTYSSEAQRGQQNMAFQTETVQIPYSERGLVVLPDGVPRGPGFEGRFGWELKSQSFLTSVSRLLVAVYYTARTNVIYDEADKIAGLVNRLMKPFDVSNFYRFEGAQSSLVGVARNVGGDGSADTYQFQYSWVRESGIPLPSRTLNPDGPGAGTLEFPSGSASQLPGGQTQSDWLLPPFHNLIAYRQDSAGSAIPDLAKPHKFRAVCPYAFDGENERSWRQLPGLVQ